ncbi:MAG: hypothetical protein MZV65_29650 [Chromatiales bacterium]|nr:hypothetical protein [Chromatiales bacterium]
MIAMALACRPQAADLRRADHGAGRHHPGADPRRCSTSCRREMGMALLFITHDLNLVRRFTHRVGVMERGRLVETRRHRRGVRAAAAPLHAAPAGQPRRSAWCSRWPTTRRVLVQGDAGRA